MAEICPVNSQTPPGRRVRGESVVAGSKPLSRNEYNVNLVVVAVKRALLEASGRA